MRVEFQDNDGIFTSSSGTGRQWRITRTVTGWRLEFRDAGDTSATYAGNHPSLEAAKAEASK